MCDQGKVVAAICHGPQVLIEADVLRGKHCTSFKAVKTDVVNAGGLYEDSEVVVDGHLVTSRIPSDLPAFCREIVRLLETAKVSG
jgi:protease I